LLRLRLAMTGVSCPRLVVGSVQVAELTWKPYGSVSEEP
jgi:hypothetical protein